MQEMQKKSVGEIVKPDFMSPLERWAFNKAMSFNYSGELKALAFETGIDYFRLRRISKSGGMKVSEFEALLEFIRKKEHPDANF